MTVSKAAVLFVAAATATILVISKWSSGHGGALRVGGVLDDLCGVVDSRATVPVAILNHNGEDGILCCDDPKSPSLCTMEGMVLDCDDKTEDPLWWWSWLAPLPTSDLMIGMITNVEALTTKILLTDGDDDVHSWTMEDWDQAQSTCLIGPNDSDNDQEDGETSPFADNWMSPVQQFHRFLPRRNGGTKTKAKTSKPKHKNKPKKNGGNNNQQNNAQANNGGFMARMGKRFRRQPRRNSMNGVGPVNPKKMKQLEKFLSQTDNPGSWTPSFRRRGPVNGAQGDSQPRARASIPTGRRRKKTWIKRTNSQILAENNAPYTYNGDK